jgi:riboflavin biosynthesis pyrimidine reductase
MTETRPHIICHMASFVDGKIDGKALQRVMFMGEYESNSKSVESEC